MTLPLEIARSVEDTRPAQYLAAIIPVYDEAGCVGQVLSGLREDDRLKDIIVVDDGSTDGTLKKYFNVLHWMRAFVCCLTQITRVKDKQSIKVRALLERHISLLLAVVTGSRAELDNCSKAGLSMESHWRSFSAFRTG